MKERTRKRLLLLGGIAAGSALFAMAYGPIIGQFQGFEVSPRVLLRFGIHGLMFGVFVGWFEVFYANGVGAEWFYLCSESVNTTGGGVDLALVMLPVRDVALIKIGDE